MKEGRFYPRGKTYLLFRLPSIINHAPILKYGDDFLIPLRIKIPRERILFFRLGISMAKVVV